MAEEGLGPEALDTAACLSRLAALLLQTGDLKRARSLLERGQATSEKVHGPDHPRTAMCLNNLASVLEATGDRKGARTLLERAVAICEKGLGAEHPLTAQALANLSLLLMDMGEREAARPYAERAWKVNIGQLRTLLPAMSGAERCSMVQERTLQLHAYLSVFHADPSLTYDAVLAWKGAALRVDSAMLRLPPDAPAEARAAAQQLAETRRALATLVTSSTAGAERQPVAEERGHALALEVGRLERELGERVPDLAARAFREVRIADVLAALPEAKAVEERFRARFPEAPCRLLLGKAATEGAFGREARAVRFVHAATHGYFDLSGLRAAFAPSSSRGFSGRISERLPSASEEAQPRAGRRGWNPLLLSGLVLAGANAGDGGAGTDGWLSAEEIQDLDLRGVELVVLSACETGRGDLAAGEGVLGLSRALTVAGAGGFVLSLWQVPDPETSELMERFYDGLWKEGERPESALRAAQIHLLEGDRAAGRFRPSTWGAWVLTR